MKTILLTIVTMTTSGLAGADVPTGPDSINGSFERMLAGVPGVTAPSGEARDNETDFQFERSVNAAVRGDMDGLVLGFANMLARVKEKPRALTVRGERDPVEVMVTEALQAQRRTDRLQAALQK